MEAAVVDSIVWSVSGWVSHDKVFVEISMHDLTISWAAVIKIRPAKPVISSWMRPPLGVLKLNLMGAS